MIRDDLEALLSTAVTQLVSEGYLPGGMPTPEVTEPRDPSHGDFACSFALVVSKQAGKPPREVAEKLVALLSASDLVEEIEIAGPGFLNIRIPGAKLGSYVSQILALGPSFGDSAAKSPSRINVEFVSVNPNGPVTVGSGRGAAFGSVLCNVLSAAGHTVHREFYINDGTSSEQMRLFGLSVAALAKGEAVPDNGYKGDYVQALADEVHAGDEFSDDPAWWQAKTQDLMISRHKTDLRTFGVEFDTWFSEQSLHDSGAVGDAINELIIKEVADRKPERTVLKMARGGVIEEVLHETQVVDEDDSASGTHPTIWLRSTKFRDDMDRVIRRKDGRPTYIASDVAYHADKFNRPAHADKLITILGPDHHGYIGRLQAVLAAAEVNPVESDCGEPLNEIDAKIYTSPAQRDACLAALAQAKRELDVVIFQIVRFMKNGAPAPMRKRDGNIYALIDLVDEIGTTMLPEGDSEARRKVGKDVARFFYLMRSHDTHMDFDIDMATKSSDENPVFYVQYAHARICSILRKAAEAGLQPGGNGHLLTHPKEAALIKKIADLPWEVRRCAEDFGVHRLTTYAQDLARSYHLFYDACRVIQPDEPALTQDRLLLCQAAQTAFRRVFRLLGIEAPETM